MGVFYKEVSPCQMKNRDPWDSPKGVNVTLIHRFSYVTASLKSTMLYASTADDAQAMEGETPTSVAAYWTL